jgi:hypothetical protein
MDGHDCMSDFFLFLSLIFFLSPQLSFFFLFPRVAERRAII